MKTIELSKSGKNFTAVNVGKLNDINQYVLPLKYLQVLHWVQQEATSLSKHSSPDKIVASSTIIKHTRNFTSFLKAKDSIRLMAKRSMFLKEASYAWHPKASVH